MKKVSYLKTAITFADALYDGAAECCDLQTVYDRALYLRNLSPQNFTELNKLNNPLIKSEEKLQLLSLVAEKLKLNEPMANMLKIMAQKNKLNLLLPTIEQFIELYQSRHNIAEVVVTTVQALSASQEQLLKQKLTKIFQKEIVLRYIINPQIIGGLVLQYGSNLIDVSIKHKLDALEKLMKGNE